MDSVHPDLPKYEMVTLPPNLEAVKVEPDVFITEKAFEIPVPKDREVTGPPAKKKSDKLMTYDEFMKTSSKEGEIYLPADPPVSTQPRPQAAAIRYRHRAPSASAGQEEADSATGDGEERETFDFNIEC